MTEFEAMKAKYANTAFAIIYEPRDRKPMTKEELARERRLASSARSNAMRKAKTKVQFDNRQKANWTI